MTTGQLDVLDPPARAAAYSLDEFAGERRPNVQVVFPVNHQHRRLRPLGRETAVIAVPADNAVRAGVDGIDREGGAGRAADQEDPILIPSVFLGVGPNPFDRAWASAICSS